MLGYRVVLSINAEVSSLSPCGLGKIPKLLNDALRIEGIVVFDEGVPASVTYRDFRAPGKYFSGRNKPLSDQL